MTGKNKGAHRRAANLGAPPRQARHAALLLAFLLCAAAGMRLRNGGGDQSEAEAIKSIRTEEKDFCNDRRRHRRRKTADLEALAALCGDFGVSPTSFVTPDWAEDHASLCAKLTAKGGALGLYLEGQPAAKAAARC